MDDLITPADAALIQELAAICERAGHTTQPWILSAGRAAFTATRSDGVHLTLEVSDTGRCARIVTHCADPQAWPDPDCCGNHEQTDCMGSHVCDGYAGRSWEPGDGKPPLIPAGMLRHLVTAWTDPALLTPTASVLAIEATGWDCW
jgi:hypothetical protein